MKIFNFEAADYREEFEAQGWAHIRGGVSPEFLEALRSFSSSRDEHRVEGRAIGGSKAQALVEFPDAADFPGEIFDTFAAMCGLQRAGMTLSERHLKAYDPDAPPEPTAHKDRFASQISVGLSIEIPDDSELILYPHDQVGANPYNVSAALLQNLPPDHHPDLALAGAREVVIDDAPGDVVVFPGSAVWHLRRRAADAVNVYLKMNDFGSDPLGEDPATELRRSATLTALQAEDSSLGDLVPVLARRLDTVTRRYLRDSWEELIEAWVWERGPVELSEADLRLLRECDGELDATALLSGSDAGVDRLRALAEAEIVDLLGEPLPGINGSRRLEARAGSTAG